MKQSCSLLLVLLLLSSILLIGAEGASGKETLYVFNWGEYIPDGSDGSLNINQQFEKETGIQVKYSTFESNEAMYAKLKGGGANYDIVIPSDYMIARMIQEDMLQPLNFSNIPNYQYIAAQYRDLYYDPENRYSVPYTAGTVGLIYNTKYVKEEPDSWEILWDETYQGKVLMFNNPRDAFAIAQKLDGTSLNSTNRRDWESAAERLKKQKKNLQAYVMDEVFNKMEKGEAVLAPYYAGDFIVMQENNPDLAFCFPKEGFNIFVDAICIPKDARNQNAAEAYINFLCRPDIALEIAEYIGYTSPNTEVVEMEDYSLAENEVVYPSEEILAKGEYFHYLPPEHTRRMDSLWLSVKIENNNPIYKYLTMGTVALLVGGYLFFRLRSRRRKKQRELAL